MPKVQIVTLDEEPAASTAMADPHTIDSRVVFAKDQDGLHMQIHRLGPGASLKIDGQDFDKLIYVWRGAAIVADTRLDERTSLIVERGAAAGVASSPDGATLIVFHINARMAEPRAGGHVHLLPKDRVPRVDDFGGAGIAGGALHADAQCPTCRVWLHENDFYQPDYEVGVHSHSEDEIIFVRDGGIKLGNRLYGPGTSLAIAANTKYRFRAGPKGLSFINFRAAPPFAIMDDPPQVNDETELWWRICGKPAYQDLVMD